MKISINSDIAEKLKALFADVKGVISLYVYGSCLTDRYNPGISDIDVLMIISDETDNLLFLESVKEKIIQEKDMKLDINIVFYSEFLERWHIYRPATYFIGVKKQNELIFGKDLLSEVKDEEATANSVYKRIVDLAQSSRGIYLNSKDPSFWERKYAKWLQVSMLEILLLDGEFSLDFRKGLRELQKRHQNLEFLDELEKDSLGMKDINSIAEKMRLFVKGNYIK